MPQRLKQIVRNRSSRQGVVPRLIVLHTTQGHNRPGTSDLSSLASWFDNPDSQASSHKGVDSEGNRITMVEDHDKSWTQANANPYSLSIEQVGFAKFTKGFWIKRYHRGLKATAEIIADWSITHKIPIRHSTSRGVCQHVDISGPGGHTDCGTGYPETYVIYWARLIAWRKRGRPAKGRSRAAWYKARVLAVQVRYAGKRLGT